MGEFNFQKFILENAYTFQVGPNSLFKEVSALRKNGELNEALQKAEQAFNEDSNDLWNKRALAWVQYDLLKKNVGTNDDLFIKSLECIKKLDLPKEDNMLFDTCAWQIGKFVFKLTKAKRIDYLKLNRVYELIKLFHFTKPSEQYTFIYKAFHKAYKGWSKYLDFADWWNFSNFRSQDYLKEEFNSRQIMSIVEQAFIAYSKRLLDSLHDGIENTIVKERVEKFESLLDLIIEQHPEYQYPPYYKAKLLLALGTERSPLSKFLPFAKKKKNEFWVWELMAEIFATDNEKQIACFCKALSLNTPEDFIVKTRETFAEILVKKEMYPEAKTEIEQVIKTRESQGWKLSDRIQGWTKTNWFKNAENLENNNEMYQRYIVRAEEILYDDVPEEYAVVEFVNRSKKVLSFVIDKSKCGYFNYHRYLSNPQIGDIIKIRPRNSGQGAFYRVYSAQKVDDINDHIALRNFSGTVELIKPHNFGFVGEVYIPNHMVKGSQLMDSQDVSGKAVLSFNKKKNEWGWKAFNVEITS